MTAQMSKKEERAWHFIVHNRKMPAHEVAAKLGVDEAFVEGLIARIGSDNWREPVPEKPTFMKADHGKARYDLLPPEFLEETAKVLEFGARKYDDHNWARGADWGRYFSAMQRHMWAWWGGESDDPETGLTHLAHAACCLSFLMAYEARGLGTDNRPDTARKEES